MLKSFLILILILSSTCFAEDKDKLNRFSIGPIGMSTVSGFKYSLEAMRIIAEEHAVFFRSNQVTDTSEADYILGYRYFFGRKGWTDAWFVEGTYTNSRDVSRELEFDFILGTSDWKYEFKKDEYFGAVFGYQWVFYERVNLEYGVGWNFDTSSFEREEVTGVLSIGILF